MVHFPDCLIQNPKLQIVLGTLELDTLRYKKDRNRRVAGGVGASCPDAPNVDTLVQTAGAAGARPGRH